MNPIKENMPLIASNEGVWDGWYRYYNAEGDKTDEHRSRLICRLVDDEKYPYKQTNIYTWEDGRKDVREFPAYYRDGRMIFDNDLIDGWAAENPLDDFNRSSLLYWTRREDPSIYFYEMIQVSDNRKYRSRVWHWFRDQKLFQRTLIDEEFVSPNWQDYEDY